MPGNGASGPDFAFPESRQQVTDTIILNANAREQGQPLETRPEFCLPAWKACLKSSPPVRSDHAQGTLDLRHHGSARQLLKCSRSVTKLEYSSFTRRCAYSES